MLPNDDVLIVDDGFPKFVRLNRPNVSKRNWNLSRSLIGKFLNTEKLTLCEPGPNSRCCGRRSRTRKLSGAIGYKSATVKAVASMHPIRCPRPQSAVGV